MRAFDPSPRSSRRSLWDQVRERVLLSVMRDLGPLRLERVTLPGTTMELEVRYPVPAAASAAPSPSWANTGRQDRLLCSAPIPRLPCGRSRRRRRNRDTPFRAPGNRANRSVARRLLDRQTGPMSAALGSRLHHGPTRAIPYCGARL